MKRDNPLFVVDTHAILAYLFGESGGNIVRKRLSVAREGGCRLLISAMSVCEVCYIVERRKGVEAVGEALALLQELPAQVVDLDRAVILAAARVKAGHPISLGDAFVAALALDKGATVVTGDPDFKHVEHLVPVLWLTA
jgi:predicted nucleic acid-binding protein